MISPNTRRTLPAPLIGVAASLTRDFTNVQRKIYRITKVLLTNVLKLYEVTDFTF